MTRSGVAAMAAWMAVAAASGALLQPRGVKAAEEVTWRRQIAPMVYTNCTSCHHAGGSGPFALESYSDAKHWGRLMQTVTASRYMPPWLPAPGVGHFEGNRRLSEEEISLLGAWVKAGMPEGTGSAPAAPRFASDWALGKPDLVVEMAQAMSVPASGTDLFENFAMPVPITETRWVRAMEIKPGSAQVTHHANVIVDRTGSVRRGHPDDWQRGVPGMDILVDSGDAFEPDSHFLFWKPDSTALVEPAGMPWRLDPGNDLVLNMHLKPTGKPETVRARIGLYFTDKPATEQPMLLQLENDAALDIPAGANNFVVEDQLKLPVAVEVLGIYPHAHSLGKRLEAWATLPDGQRRGLVLIPDWDIDRQSVYRLAAPLELPAGSTVHMRYTYDNSAANVRNPNSPPVRVRAGNRSADEMAHFWLQVLPKHTPGETDDPRRALETAWMENRLRKNPADALAEYNLASMLLENGDAQAAVARYRTLLAQHPDDARTMTSLGTALEQEGDVQGARGAFRQAMERSAGDTDAAFDLATVDLRVGELTEAARLFGELAQANPKDAAASAGLAETLLAQGDRAGAKEGFRRVLDLDPRSVASLDALGQMALEDGDVAGARTLLERAEAAGPDAETHRTMAMMWAASGKPEKAVDELKAWQRMAPKDAEARRALAQVYRQMGALRDAVGEERAVVTMNPDTASDWNDLGVMEAEAGDKAAARSAFEHALRIEPGNAAAAGNLRRL